MPDFKEKPVSLSISDHPRLSEFNRLVYPVVSRRAGGLSLGINLNPQKNCSFNCVYCQVDRSKKIENLEVTLTQVLSELDEWLADIRSTDGYFQGEALKDISIAGDGEPTLKKELPDIIHQALQVRDHYHFQEVKLNLFTNGSGLDKQPLQAAFQELYENNGEIWFKLDFWNRESYDLINRSKVSHLKILENLKQTGEKYPLVIQSCFFSWNGQAFSQEIYQAYVDLILDLLDSGVQIKEIQSYTTARIPAEASVAAWSDQEMDQLHDFFSNRLNLPIKTIYKNGVKST